jgi:hypothetical protein
MKRHAGHHHGSARHARRAAKQITATYRIKWEFSASIPQVKETVRDVRFLHNELFFAAAQRKYVYIYDKRGIEVHCLKVLPMMQALATSIPL